MSTRDSMPRLQRQLGGIKPLQHDLPSKIGNVSDTFADLVQPEARQRRRPQEDHIDALAPTLASILDSRTSGVQFGVFKVDPLARNVDSKSLRERFAQAGFDKPGSYTPCLCLNGACGRVVKEVRALLVANELGAVLRAAGINGLFISSPVDACFVAGESAHGQPLSRMEYGRSTKSPRMKHLLLDTSPADGTRAAEWLLSGRE